MTSFSHQAFHAALLCCPQFSVINWSVVSEWKPRNRSHSTQNLHSQVLETLLPKVTLVFSLPCSTETPCPSCCCLDLFKNKWFVIFVNSAVHRNTSKPVELHRNNKSRNIFPRLHHHSEVKETFVSARVNLSCTRVWAEKHVECLQSRRLCCEVQPLQVSVICLLESAHWLAVPHPVPSHYSYEYFYIRRGRLIKLHCLKRSFCLRILSLWEDGICFLLNEKLRVLRKSSAKKTTTTQRMEEYLTRRWFKAVIEQKLNQMKVNNPFSADPMVTFLKWLFIFVWKNI